MLSADSESRSESPEVPIATCLEVMTAERQAQAHEGGQLIEGPLTSQECGDRNTRSKMVSTNDFKLKTLHLQPVWSLDDAAPGPPDRPLLGRLTIIQCFVGA